ncbi:hypothetical protein K2O51_23340 [Cupriavidus pinatubonensis]|nr:hypothetical protein K2O51_23340 [Cupriavidus pinatubonensis]
MPKLMRKQILLAKIEAVSGTDPVPTGAANAILVRATTPQPLVVDNVPRNLIRAYFGNSENIPVGEHSEMDVEVELAGAGAAGTAPGYGPLLRACGLSETVTAATDVKYAPITGNNETVTLYFYLDGLLHKMIGCVGTVAFDITAKQIPFMRFKFIGAFSPVTDGANPTADYTKFIAPRIANKTNTATWALHGYTGALSALQLDLANDIAWRALIGSESSVLTDRKPAGSVTLDLGTVASQDWWTKVRGAVLDTLSITHGLTAGNIVKIDAPKVQLSNLQYSDDSGIAQVSANLILVPNAGNDEFLLTVK